jgi:hypothetical protein
MPYRQWSLCKAVGKRERSSGRPSSAIHLGEDAVEMGIDRLHANVQRESDVLVGFPSSDKSQHLDFASGEPRWVTRLVDGTLDGSCERGKLLDK